MVLPQSHPAEGKLFFREKRLRLNGVGKGPVCKDWPNMQREKGYLLVGSDHDSTNRVQGTGEGVCCRRGWRGGEGGQL